MKKTLIIIASVIVSIIAIFALCVWIFGFSTTTNNSLTDYTERRASSSISQQVMPNLDDLLVYKDIYYQYRHKRMLIFSADTMLLVVTYDEATYQAEKSKLNDFDYLQEPSVYKDRRTGKDTYLLPEPEFSINSFNFKVLNRTNGFEFPKYIGIIATSDEKNSIAYLYYDDVDMDYISEDEAEGVMAKFVKEYFRYKW